MGSPGLPGRSPVAVLLIAFGTGPPSAALTRALSDVSVPCTETGRGGSCARSPAGGGMCDGSLLDRIIVLKYGKNTVVPSGYLVLFCFCFS